MESEIENTTTTRRNYSGCLYAASFMLIAFTFIFLYELDHLFDGKWEENGEIEFVNKKNASLLILQQSYLSGAWDNGKSYRFVKKNMLSGEIESVDTSKIDSSEWIHMKVPGCISNLNSGFCFPDESFQKSFKILQSTSSPIFKLKHQKYFKEFVIPLAELPVIFKNFTTYCDNTFCQKFKTYILRNGDELILQTMNNDFTTIDSQVIMKKFYASDYVFHAYTTFVSTNQFLLVKNYKTFKVDADCLPKKHTVEEIDIINYYEITEDGHIAKKDLGPYGAIYLYPKLTI
ncbi:MAG TPA: hypothetical protein VK177_17825 [Flavobacteriales bacterium]|nr:hypothetical protein [Flavobacteriales bacterium]